MIRPRLPRSAPLAAALAALSAPAAAQTRVNEADGGPPPFLEGPPRGLGLGLVVGSPSGLAGSWRPRGRTMIQAAAGWSLTEGRLNINADYLYDITRIEPSDTPEVTWPVYVGAGARLRLGADGDDGGLGVRIPVGMRLEPEDLRLDVYLEIAPVLLLLPETTVTFDAGLGARFYFGKG